MASLFQLPKASPVSAGNSFSGAKLYFYQAGTLTPITTYTTAALSVAHNHPVVADSNGIFAPIFLNDATNQTYRIQLTTSADVLLYDVDNLRSRESSLELGTAGDTTLSRASAGVLAVEGNNVATVSQAQTITAAWTFNVEIRGNDEADASGSAFIAAALVPAYRWYRTAAAADSKYWQASVGPSSWGLFVLSDDLNTINNAITVNRSGTTVSDIRLTASGTEALRVDANATAGNTRFMIYDVDNATLERVSVGAADSGGAGFKLLRIAN